jgi:hypothetical protein
VINAPNSAARLSAFAEIPRELAEFVTVRAHENGLCLRDLRSDCRRRELCEVRWSIAAEARALKFGQTSAPRFTYWQIARALNRDRSSIVHALKRVGQ